MGNIIAIVGRPNVGKSTFFNRLTETRQAIVDSTSGVTRDRHYGKSDWNGIDFSVIDTGGYIVGSEDVFEKEICKQVDLAIDESDVIVFMLDAREGLTPMDEEVANLLRKSKKKIFVVANKVDTSEKMHEASEFFSMGLGNIYPVSAINGSGTGELLDDIVKEFKHIKKEDAPDVPKIAVIGRPNVGKSSFINSLLGDERNIVTPVPGTTRDSIYTPYKNFGFDFLLVDTAGLRKKGKVHENIEFYSVMRSIRAIENSDVCLLLVDATIGFETQDINIIHIVERNKKGLVIIVNKWDLVEKDTNTHLVFEEKIKSKISPFVDVPIIFTSVMTRQRIIKSLEIAKQVYENRSRRISTSNLNNVLLPLIEKYPPPSYKGKYIKIKYVTQLKLKYPAFVFFCNNPQYVKEPYMRFLENKIRENYDFSGVPMQIFFRKK